MIESIVLCDQAADPSLTPAMLATMATQYRVDLNSRFCPVWGGQVSVRVGALSTVGAREFGVIFQPTLGDIAPGAAAFHDRLPNGAPVAYIGWQESGATLHGAQLSGDHEIKEGLVDPGANRWAVMADGVTLQAIETADRVEDTSYVDGVGVMHTNFLLPSAFDPGAPGPYDFLAVLTDPEGMTPGGYMIQMTSGDISQVTPNAAKKGIAKHPTGMHVYLVGKDRERHKSPTSRAYRRGVRL